MLNVCTFIRPAAIIITALAFLSILAPVFFDNYWPYLAAGGVLLVPVIIYRWWDERYNPGCSVRFTDPDQTES